jgi:hypothetical protein
MMQRSLSQVLFQFLPGNTFDYSDGRGIWRVNRLETSDVSGKIDTKYVSDRVSARTDNWDGGSEGFPAYGDQNAFHFGRPEGVKAEPFPTVYECNKCGHVEWYWDADDVLDENPQQVCTRDCPGNLNQIQFVSVHSCGELKGLSRWSCPNHGATYVQLNRRGSQKVSNFKWECGICSASDEVSHRESCDCNYQPPSATPDNEDTMYTTVHRAGSVYYPHYFNKINLVDSNMGYLQQSEEGVLKAFARLTNLSDTPELDKIDLGEDVNEGEIDEDRVVEVFSANDEMSLDDAKEYLREQGEIDSVTIGDRIRELILDRETLDTASEGLIQYTLGVQDLSTHNIEDLAGQARDRGFPSKSDRIRTYRDDLDDAGISGVRVIEDFPIQTFVYGYTRGGREEDEAQIQAFSQGASDGSGTPIFVNTSETEGVQVDLDPRRVALWLSANYDEVSDSDEVQGPVTLPSVNPEDPASVQYAWQQLEELSDEEIWAFFQNHFQKIEQYERFNMSDPESLDEEITEDVFTLIHTLSHIFLKQSSTISGFDRTNLSEYLLPRALSFAIYSNNRDEFNIGGMRTMVEQDLDHLLSQARNHGNECVYDPVCSERDGACLSCLFVSEISCSYFNQVLCRDYLYGSRPNTGRDMTGFWELDYTH